jgi:hypothetical protein
MRSIADFNAHAFRFVIARREAPWQSSSFHPARSAAD